jgi:hypothetical protein
MTGEEPDDACLDEADLRSSGRKTSQWLPAAADDQNTVLLRLVAGALFMPAQSFL